MFSDKVTLIYNKLFSITQKFNNATLNINFKEPNYKNIKIIDIKKLTYVFNSSNFYKNINLFIL
jgi:hypothetical protein